MFVQEFVRVERPLSDAVSAFESTVIPRFADLIHHAWQGDSNMEVLTRVGVFVSAPRARLDGVAYSVSWPSTATGIPEVDSDIEFSSVSEDETHVEFAGQSAYPFVQPWSLEDRQANRECMAAVDRLLRSIAALIETDVRTDR